MGRRGERPTTWIWVCRNCEASDFVEPPAVCPGCGATGEFYDWYPLEER